MQDFLASVTDKLGIPADVARGATGSLLGLVKDQADEEDFDRLAAEVPGARELADEGAAPAAGGGLLGSLGGGLAGAAGSLLGGAGGGGLASLVGLLGKSGLDASKAGDFARMFATYLKGKLSPDLLATLTSKVPALKALL